MAIKDKAPTTVPNLITFGSKFLLSSKVTASVFPIQAQDVSLGDDIRADERSRTQVMRRGLKFQCATNKVDLVRDGCTEFEALVLALGRLEGRVFNSLDAFVVAREDPHFGVEKVNGR